MAKHLCSDCVKADTTCPVYLDVEHVGYCIEYRPKISKIDVDAVTGESTNGN